MNKVPFKSALARAGRIAGRQFINFLGILGWLIKMLVSVLTVGLIILTCTALILYVRLKPELDQCRETAYDILAQMDRQDFSKLPDTIIYDKDGQQIGRINAGHYEYVDITRISMNIQNAYIAQEDRRFKSHTGVDWIATFRAGLALIKHHGEVTQGGSTITQQVIKNTYLTQEQTFTRKIIEILLAPEVEKQYSKADIMEFYCNTNFYGHHCYGVQAASRYYFGKDAADLDVDEAAVLVGISNSPSAYDPVAHPDACLTKRNDVLKSMNEIGELSDEEYEKACQKPLHIVQLETEGTDENYQSSYAIHCAALELMKQEDFSFQYTFADKNEYDTYMERYDALYSQKSDLIRSGGFRIYTSLDSNLQQQLQTSLDQVLASYTELQDNGKYALQGAAVIVDNQTNYVTAIVGGRGTEDPFNRAYLSARQPGSTIKPLLDYGPAFDTGEYYPSRMIDDHKWEDGPSNSGGSYYGMVTVREALNRSLNTVAWQVLEDIGVDFGLNYLAQMDFQKISYIDNDVPSLSIGGFTNGLRVVDMAKGYSTLANQGVYNDSTCILGIEHTQQGDLTKNITHSSRQVYQEDTAFMITDILKGTLTSPYGTGRGLALENGMPAAAKTGTTNSSRDTWFCGYTRYYTTAVWVGYDIPRTMPGIYGSTYAGKIWKDVMDKIHTGLAPLDWTQPETVVRQTDPSNGIEDYFSTTAQARAEHSLYQKEQDQLAENLEASVTEFESFTISTVEDTYEAQNRYQKITSQLPLLDDGTLRSQLLERTETKYAELKTIINGMSDTIRMYEEQQAAQAQKQQEEAEQAAAESRAALEQETKKNTFLQALAAVEEMEYQQPDAQALIQDAISKLSLVAGDPQEQEYANRLNAAITRISTLPTAQEWQQQQAAQEISKAAQENQDQAQVQAQQQRLQNTLRQEQPHWNNMEQYGPGGRPTQ